MSGVRRVKTESELAAYMGAAERVAVKFTARWCGPCKKIAPRYEALSRELGSYPGFVFLEVDIDEYDEDLADTFGITSIPAVLLFFRGAQWASVTGADESAMARACEGLAKQD